MQEEKFLNVLRSRMVDGIIYVSSDYATSNKLLADLSIPVVFIDRKIEKSGNMGSVQIDNYQAMKEVAEYISKKGCKKIAYITADISVSPSRERYEGLMDGLKEAGIAFDKRLHYPGTFSVETGQIGAMTLLQRNPAIDCIVCGNDLMAIGAMSICQKLGRKVPDDIKIMGFDDIYISKYLNPELTTVRQDAYEMGKQAAEMLIEHIEQKSLLKDIVLSHEIVDQLTEVADDLGTNLAILSLAWILQHPEISCVIAGASKPSQLENNLKASDLVIPQDAMDRIENILGFKRFERHVG